MGSRTFTEPCNYGSELSGRMLGKAYPTVKFVADNLEAIIAAALAFQTGTGPIGPEGPKGNDGKDGKDASDIGTLAQAKAKNIGQSNPDLTVIRLTDRAKPLFQKDTGAFGDLVVDHPEGQDVWWFKDLGNTRWVITGNSISIQNLGAVRGKQNDNTAIINQTASISKLLGVEVTVPVGTWGHFGSIEIESTRLVGTPGRSIFYCNKPGKGSINLRGRSPSIYGISRVHEGGYRVAADEGNGINIFGAIDFDVSHCYIEGVPAAGIMNRGGQFGQIHDNRVNTSLADAIHNTAAGVGDVHVYDESGAFVLNAVPIPVRHVDVFDNRVRNAGDDYIAVVSYLNHSSQQPTANPVVVYPGYRLVYTEADFVRTYHGLNGFIQIHDNQGLGGNARGITVVGGEFVNVNNNSITDPAMAALLCYAEDSFDTYGVSSCTFQNNMIVSSGNDGSYRPARYLADGITRMRDSDGNVMVRNHEGNTAPSMIIAGRNGLYPADTIVVQNNTFYDCRSRGIGVYGNAINIDIGDNTIKFVKGSAVYLDGVDGAAVYDNGISDTMNEAIVLIGAGLRGDISIYGNKLHNIGSNVPGQDAIHLEGQEVPANLGKFEISYNSITGPKKYERFIEAFSDIVIAENNTGDGDVALGRTPYSVKQRTKAANTPVVATSANPSGTAPADLSGAVSRADFDALVTYSNRLKDKINALLTALSNAGIQK